MQRMGFPNVRLHAQNFLDFYLKDPWQGGVSLHGILVDSDFFDALYMFLCLKHHETRQDHRYG